MASKRKVGKAAVPGRINDKADIYGKAWIVEHGKAVLEQYSSGITVRQLHYRLVAQGMINDLNHYKRTVKAMSDARWEGEVDFTAFIDRERQVVGSTDAEEKDVADEIENAKTQIKAWMSAYGLDRWSNQPKYVEVWIEKKALQGVFERPTMHMDVALCPCKGYPSLTYLHEAVGRFQEAKDRDQEVIILYAGDYDPSGEDIPRSIRENLARMGCSVTVERIALTPEQIGEMGLPGVPAKETDTRTARWDGAEVVELDAVEPETLRKMAEEAIQSHFDEDLYQELNDREEKEREQYQKAVRDFVVNFKEQED